MLPSKTGLPGSDPVSQSQQSLVLEFYPTNQLVVSKFDSGDLTLLLIGSACSKDLTFAARGTSELQLTPNFHNTADSKLQAASRTSGTQCKERGKIGKEGWKGGKEDVSKEGKKGKGKRKGGREGWIDRQMDKSRHTFDSSVIT